MVEDAPVNTGAVTGPSAQAAAVAVRRMQVKLHQWAREDPSRQFGDLFNLVYDPAFLADAFARVAGNPGARTAGVDGRTVAQIRSGIGVDQFLSDLRQGDIDDEEIKGCEGEACRDDQQDKRRRGVATTSEELTKGSHSQTP